MEVEYMLVVEDKVLLLKVGMVDMLESKDDEDSDEEEVINKELGIVRTLGIDVACEKVADVFELDTSSGTEDVGGA